MLKEHGEQYTATPKLRPAHFYVSLEVSDTLKLCHCEKCVHQYSWQVKHGNNLPRMAILETRGWGKLFVFLHVWVKVASYVFTWQVIASDFDFDI